MIYLEAFMGHSIIFQTTLTCILSDFLQTSAMDSPCFSENFEPSTVEFGRAVFARHCRNENLF